MLQTIKNMQIQYLKKVIIEEHPNKNVTIV